MSLAFICDVCGDIERGDAICYLSSEVADSLPDNWGMCRHNPRQPVEILCGSCYSAHRMDYE